MTTTTPDLALDHDDKILRAITRAQVPSCQHDPATVAGATHKKANYVAKNAFRDKTSPRQNLSRPRLAPVPTPLPITCDQGGQLFTLAALAALAMLAALLPKWGPLHSILQAPPRLPPLDRNTKPPRPLYSQDSAATPRSKHAAFLAPAGARQHT